MKTPLKSFLAALAVSSIFFLSSCGGESNANESSNTPEAVEEVAEEPASNEPNKGIGPISNIEIGPLDDALATTGEEIFTTKCTACHKMEERHVGPPLKGVTEKRTPEWIMNMILNPDEMTKNDPDATALLVEYNLSPMANQNLTEDDARAVLEYFRKHDGAQ